ncbi:hypothetical protein QYM36_019594 [Artemia franciscana]|uniref:Methyltransferase FkbM domain-containing protein n=1 Tax=Artemia franciscana TaxID=6661 RepID=A0AA88H521_ARTSF|nr:hypothetical protein QYM36_019594 [Artemia franciscana]
MSQVNSYNLKRFFVNPAIGQIPNSGRIEEALFVQNQVKTDLIQVKCVPVYSMLLAVNITTIDLFILDVEGVEMDILETIPFEKVNISVLLIEVHGKKKELRTKMHSYLVSKGYSFYDTFSGRLHPGDDIFIKEEYYNSQDRMKMKKINVRQLYKIITGTKEEDISQSDLKVFSALTSLS